MDTTPLRQSVDEMRRERERLVQELNAARLRVSNLTGLVEGLERAEKDLEAVLRSAIKDTATRPLPMPGLPPYTSVAVAVSEIVQNTLQAQRRNHERNDLILKVMATGPRDWNVSDIVTEMRARGWTEGLTQPDAAIRIALDRMAKKNVGVVKTDLRTFRLRTRMAEPGSPPINTEAAAM